MSDSISSPRSGIRGRTIAIWSLRILLAALFAFAALAKISGQPMMVAEFGQVGLGQSFRYLVAALELIGAAALVTPRVSIYGAGLLLLVDVGACIAQVTRIHHDWIHTIVIGALLVLAIVLQRPNRTAIAR